MLDSYKSIRFKATSCLQLNKVLLGNLRRARVAYSIVDTLTIVRVVQYKMSLNQPLISNIK